jgi:hypothetical protein
LPAFFSATKRSAVKVTASFSPIALSPNASPGDFPPRSLASDAAMLAGIC